MIVLNFTIPKVTTKDPIVYTVARRVFQIGFEARVVGSLGMKVRKEGMMRGMAKKVVKGRR